MTKLKKSMADKTQNLNYDKTNVVFSYKTLKSLLVRQI